VATGWADLGTPRHSAQVDVRLETRSDDPIMFIKAADRMLSHLFQQYLLGGGGALAPVSPWRTLDLRARGSRSQSFTRISKAEVWGRPLTKLPGTQDQCTRSRCLKPRSQRVPHPSAFEPVCSPTTHKSNPTMQTNTGLVKENPHFRGKP